MNQVTTKIDGDLESLGKEIRNIQLDHINAMDGINLILDKAQFMLNKISDDYSYAKAPDHNSIKKLVNNWGAVRPTYTQEIEQASQWALGYTDVSTMVRIALDYVWEAKQELIKAGASHDE